MAVVVYRLLIRLKVKLYKDSCRCSDAGEVQPVYQSNPNCEKPPHPESRVIRCRMFRMASRHKVLSLQCSLYLGTGLYVSLK